MFIKIIFLLMTTVLSYSLINNPIVSYTNKLGNLPEIRVMEPKNLIQAESTCLVFFTGGSSIIMPDVYDNFLNKLASNNISIYTPTFKYSNIHKLITELDKNYKEVILAGHSSGCSIAIEHSNEEVIKKLILLDPVKTDVLGTDKYNLQNLESILFLNAQKSYKWSLFPFGIPFVPDFLKIEKDDLDISKECKIINCQAEDYGHCDILDNKFSEQMHNSRLALGNKDRSDENMEKYHTWSANIINNYLKNQKIKNQKY
jgi:hypothetical protein